MSVCVATQSFVYGNNLYYQASPAVLPVQLTTSGDPLYVFNGVPDWLYEGYCIVKLDVTIVANIRRKPVLTYVSIVCGICCLTSVNSVNSLLTIMFCILYLKRLF